MGDVAIVGVGQSVFSRSCGLSIKELCFKAFKEAIEDLNITTNEIDASVICSAISIVSIADRFRCAKR